MNVALVLSFLADQYVAHGVHSFSSSGRHLVARVLSGWSGLLLRMKDCGEGVELPLQVGDPTVCLFLSLSARLCDHTLSICFGASLAWSVWEIRILIASYFQSTAGFTSTGAFRVVVVWAASMSAIEFLGLLALLCPHSCCAPSVPYPSSCRPCSSTLSNPSLLFERSCMPK